MTAEQVNGIAVVASEPARSPLSDSPAHDGRQPVYYERILRLLLADGAEVFGCADCDYTGAAVRNILPHMKVHKSKVENGANGNGGGRGRGGPYWDPNLLQLTLGELIERGRQADVVFDTVDQLAADRDHWKQRARDAERRLKVLRNALGGDLG